MKAWEIRTGPLFGPHHALLVSAQPRIDRKQFVAVLKGVTLRPDHPFRADALQATLDEEDGLDGSLPFDVSRVAVQWRTKLPSGTDTNWQSLNSALLSTGGILQATDTNTPLSGARYYRVVEQ